MPELELAENVICFTTSIHGGVSKGAYKSFNLGAHVGDNQNRVAINRQLLQAILTKQITSRKIAENILDFAGLQPIKWLNQSHTTNICNYESTVDGAFDGIETLSSYTPLVVMSADCLPIIIACRKTGRIAAVHAGWRGLIDNILANVVSHFASPNDLYVWLGPHISARNFQISEAIVSRFSLYPQAITAQKESGKYWVDLSEIARNQLASMGVQNVQVSSVCTYNNEHCFSHRRITHLGDQQTGRMATVVVRI